MRIGIAGYGFVGQAHHNVLKDYFDILISDPALGHFGDLRHADAIIICVSTPDDNGKCDMSNVYDIINSNLDVPFLIKSTISLEGWDELMLSHPNSNITFSPEFLRAETALKDFANTKELLMGGSSLSYWAEIFIKAMGNITVSPCPPRELILTKYFRNAFLATKVAFFNQIHDLCEATGTDYEHVRRSISSDPRIGTSHTRVTPARGFGGHCLPKDTKAITYSAGLHDVDLSILQEAINYNNIIREDID